MVRRISSRTASWIRGLLVVSIFGALLAVAAVLALSRGWQREWLVDRLENQLSDAVGAPVEIESISGPLVPELVARGVRLGDVEIAELRLRWQVGQLLVNRRLQIDRLALVGLRARLERDPNGQIRLAADLASDSASAGVEAPDESPTNWRIEDLVIEDARAEIGGALGAEPLVLDVEVDGRFERLAWAEDGWIGLSTRGRMRALVEGVALGSTIERGELAVAVREGRVAELALTTLGDLGTGAVELRAKLPGGPALDRSWPAGTSWELERLSFGAEGIEITGEGAGIGGALDRLSLDAVIDELERLTARLGQTNEQRLVGRLEASVELSGPTGRPSGEISLVGRDLAIGAQRLGRLDAALHVEGGRELVVETLSLESGVLPLIVTPGARVRFDSESTRATIEALTLRSDGQSIDVSGTLSPEGASGLSVSARNLDVDRMLALAGTPIRPGGSADVRLSVDGPWSAPVGGVDVDWRGSARPAVLALDRPRLQLELDSNGQQISFSGVLGVASRAEAAKGSGSVPIPAAPFDPRAWLRERSAHAELAAEDLELAWLTPWLPPELRVREGRASFELALDGRPTVPRLSGWGVVENGLADIPALADPLAFRACIQVEDDWVVVDGVRLGPENASATLAGRIRLEDLQPTEVDLKASFDGFQIMPATARRESRVDAESEIDPGRIDGVIELSGRFAAPVVQAALEWRAPRWQSFVLDRVTLNARREGPLVVGNVAVRYSGAEIATLDASLPVPADPSSLSDWIRHKDARVELRSEDVELGMLAPWLPSPLSDPKGRADLMLEVRGGAPSPRFEGRFGLTEGTLTVRPLGRTFESIAALARFDERSILVDSLSIGRPGARAIAEGRIGLRDLRADEVDLRLSLDHFPIARSPAVRTDMNGALSLTGKAEAPTLRGELALHDATFDIRGAEDPAVKEVRILAGSNGDPSSTEMREQVPPGPGLLDRATIDVSLGVPRDTWVRGPGLDLDVRGSARAEKPPGEPARFSGTFDAIRGSFKLQGRRFEVQRGSLLLDGGTDVDPVIEVEALHRVADVRITAFLTGRVSAPALRLESDPEMPEVDIVSYLIFGRPAEQLGASEQSGANIAAAGLVAGLALEELRAVFGDAVPVDTIDVRISEEDESHYVEIGKYVARDVFVRYGHTFGPEPEEEVGVSLRLGDHWILESTTNSDATAGGDLFWVLEY